MSRFKCTMFIKLTTNLQEPNAAEHRTGGWSESFYTPDCTVAEAKDKLLDSAGLCTRRADLLPQGAVIYGQRWTDMQTGASFSQNIQFPGSSSLTNDVPQLSLRYNMTALNGLNKRQITLRGVPDSLIVGGEYQPTTRYQNAITAFNYCLYLRFVFRGKDKAQASKQIVDVTADGLVTLAVVAGYNVGDLIKIDTRRTADNKKVSGLGFVKTTGPAATQFTIQNWTFGACSNGSAKRDEIAYFQIDNTAWGTPLACVRKVGRPTDQYRGRVSAK